MGADTWYRKGEYVSLFFTRLSLFIPITVMGAGQLDLDTWDCICEQLWAINQGEA